MPTGKTYQPDISLDDITGEQPPVESVETGDDTALDSSLANASQARYSSRPDFDADDVIMPRLRLAQGQTAEVTSEQAAVGQWVVLGGEPVDECIIIPVTAGKRRERRARMQDGSEQVVCRSPDAIMGYGTPGGDCEKCPFAQWRDVEGEGRKPPLCTFIYSYQVYSASHDMPAIVEFKGTSIQTGKLLNTMMKARGGAGFAVKLGHESRKNPRGAVYQIPTVQYVKLPAEAAEQAKMLLLPAGD